MPLDVGTTPEQVEASKNRKLKIPLTIIVEKVRISPVQVPGKPPKADFEMGSFEIKTVGDVVTLYRKMRNHELRPVPDLALQVLNIFLDLAGLLEEPTKS